MNIYNLCERTQERAEKPETININVRNCLHVSVIRLAGVILLVLAVASPAFYTAGAAPSAPADVMGGTREGSQRAVKDIELFCGRNATVVKPNGTAVYEIDLKNNGNRTEEVRLTAEGTPGWNWTGWTGTRKILANNSTKVLLEVWPPAGALGGDVGVVTVTAYSMNDTNLTGSLSTFTTVEEVLGIRLWPERNETPVAPGQTGVCNISVEKTGNSRRPLFLEALADVFGWKAELDTVQLNLEGTGLSTVALSITAPGDASAQTVAQVNISCHDRERTVVAGCTAAASVPLVRGVAVTVRPEPARLFAGGQASYELEIANLGNVEERVRAGHSVPPAGWTVVFTPRGSKDQNGSVKVPIGGSGFLDAVLHAPQNASSGYYNFTGQVLDSFGNAFNFTLGARVAQLPGIRLEAGSARPGGPPGGPAVILLNVTNLGDGVDSYSLAAAGLPGNWSPVEFTSGGKALGAANEIGPRATVAVMAVVRIPNGIDMESISFNIRATLYGGELDTARLTLAVQRPDLYIGRVDMPSAKPRAGRPEKMNLTVGNAGDAPAGNVTLTMFVNKRFLLRLDIGNIPAGQERIESVLWAPVKGYDVLRFVIASEDGAPERNGTNNEASALRTVPGGDSAPPPDRFLMLVAVAAVSIAAVALVPAFWLRRRK